jgi:hypothetical protein
MLRIFLQWFQVFFQVFLQVFPMYVSSVPSAFRRMLQVLHLNVSKVDRVLHLLPCLLLPHLGVSSSSWRRLGIRLPLPLFSMLMTFRAARAPCGRAKRCEKRTIGTGVRTRRQSGCPGASKPVFFPPLLIMVKGFMDKGLLTLDPLILTDNR